MSDYASNLIGFKIQLKGNSLNCTRIFQQVFPDDMLLNEYMRSLPITSQLSAKLTHGLASNGKNSSNTVNLNGSNSNNSLGIYFLNQWIKTNSFLNKRQLDLSSWLFEQIKQCVEPLHPVMVSLINNYVIQLFNLNILSENRLTPLSPKLILEFFRSNYSNYDAQITPKLLLMYYLLIYETKRRETLISTLNTLQNPSNMSNNNAVAVAAAMSNSSRLISASLDSLLTFRYPAEIFEYIPINYFLLKAKESNFLIIYPSLLRFVINLYTQLCQVEHCLCEPDLNSKCSVTDINYVMTKLKHIKNSLAQNDMTRNEAHMFKKLWFKAYSIHGRK